MSLTLGAVVDTCVKGHRRGAYHDMGLQAADAPGGVVMGPTLELPTLQLNRRRIQQIQQVSAF